MDEQPTFAEIAKRGFGIRIDNLNLLPDMVKKDLIQAIFICNAGMNRSVKAARESNAQGVKSVYLEGGLVDLTGPEVDLGRVAGFIKTVPKRVVFVGEEGELPYYQELVDLLGAEVVTTMRQR